MSDGLTDKRSGDPYENLRNWKPTAADLTMNQEKLTDYMGWEKKIEALKCLGEVDLYMHEPGRWAIRVKKMEIKQGKMIGSIHGMGASPQHAVNNLWDQLMNLPSNQYIVIDALGDNRKAFKWAGFMWKEIEEDA